jgi:glycine/D-amino acid oxidase-like deaminating enzyme
MDSMLIIGGGLAGSVLADKAGKRGIPVTWMNEDAAPSASAAAYGMLNPVHIRNAVLSWNAARFFPVAAAYYRSVSEQAAKPVDILHVLSSEDEAVLWRQNVESGSLQGYATGEQETYLPEILSQHAGMTRITAALFVDIPALIKAIRAGLPENVQYRNEAMDFAKLIPEGNSWRYEGKKYDSVICCEGVRALQNPWFGQLPFRPCKGDVLTVRIPGSPVQEVIHRKIFLIPLGNDLYRAGSTYDWSDLSFSPSERGKAEIMESLDALLKVPYEVTGHTAGVRPAMADRKPVLGVHPQQNGLYIFNGLGSRGLIQAPSLADWLLDHIMKGEPILPAVDVQRFRKRLSV